jgi:hypothetical protein
MSASQLPPWLVEELNSCPAAGNGVHRWMFDVMRQLHYHMPPEEIFSLIAAKTARCGRYVPEIEITKAINDSAKVQWRPNSNGTSDHPHLASQPKWPKPRMLQIRQIVNNGPGLADLVERSPHRFDDQEPHTEEIVDILFPGNPLLCIGKSQSLFATRRRETWRGRLAGMPLMVPNPMLAVQAHTKEGKLSEHTLEATGRQVY